MISVKFKIDQVTKALSDVEKVFVPRAAQQALNKAGATVKSRTQKELARVMKLKRSNVIKGVIVMRRATKGHLEVMITTSNKSIGLEHTKNASIRVTTRGKRPVATVKFKGKAIKNAFQIGQFGPIKGGVFVPAEGKYSNGRKKVKRLFAYPLLQELVHAKVDSLQEEIGMERFDIEFDRALANELRKAGLAG